MNDFSYLMMLFRLAISVLLFNFRRYGTRQAGSLPGVIYVASGLGGAIIGKDVFVASIKEQIQEAERLLPQIINDIIKAV